MPLFVLALIILVAIFGFWDTLGAIVGGVAIVAILLVAAIGFAVWTGYRALARHRT
jgi:hypothetical protein